MEDLEEYPEYTQDHEIFDLKEIIKALETKIESLEKQCAINGVVVPKGTLPIDEIEDYHIRRWNNGLENGASMDEIREDMLIAKEAMDLNNSIKWD